VWPIMGEIDGIHSLGTEQKLIITLNVGIIF
jgi:hypothetical protein